MNIKSILSPAVFLAVFITSQFPLSGQCASDDGSSAPSSIGLPEPQYKNSGEVATLIAELPEREPFNVWGVDFSPDGNYLASSSPSSYEIHVWDWKNRRIVRTLEQVHQGSSTLSATEP